MSNNVWDEWYEDEHSSTPEDLLDVDAHELDTGSYNNQYDE